ncbi:unnamed protein product [Rangifer tarandus platyrhynchus]|uniref:Uncharacterized protein n=2 Tax=Rangifer tarandus platyrhynchus TaxID=3082113 RepID=A0ACB0FGX6_RANTA|nr:unnamed protein product [Rangifer tarandus platyrhynchus]CAI9711271.1 unnamed protein product [Rangifer tarandus platyrhynchus]
METPGKQHPSWIEGMERVKARLQSARLRARAITGLLRATAAGPRLLLPVSSRHKDGQALAPGQCAAA